MTMPGISGGQVRAGPVQAPVIPLGLIGAGLFLAWFGVHYWRSDTKYPTDPLKAVLQGRPLPGAAGQQASYAAIETADYASLITPSSSSGTPAGGGSSGGGAGDTGAASQSAAANQAIAKVAAGAYGWSPSQNDGEWNNLVKLWNAESGWNNLALNSSSGAFGVAQALGHGGPGTGGKYGNQYPSKAANNGDATAQIQWGLSYIAARWHDPAGAWANEESQHWY